MIIVTGGSGKLGHAIVMRLLERVEPSRLGVSVRDPEKVDDLAKRGVSVRQADFEDASSMRAAFEGATKVILVSSNAAAFGGDPIAQHRNAISAARDAGVGRIFYTSHQAASPTSAFDPARDHATTERMLGEAKIPFTSLRNGYYASTVAMLLGDAVKTGELKAPEDGKVSWTAPADLAEAAAILATGGGERIDGPITLTAAETFDLVAVAALAAEIFGRPVKRVRVSDEDYVAALLARGLPAGAAKLFLSSFVASRAGEFDCVDPTLQKLLGRQPTPLRDVLAL